MQARYGPLWTTEIVPASRGDVALRPPATRGAPDEVRVFGVDRLGTAGQAATAAPDER